MTGVFRRNSPWRSPDVSDKRGAITTYRLATFGDSRANAGSHRTTSTAGSVSGDKVPGQLCQIRGDMEIVFNGGVSGDTTANWNNALTGRTGKTVTDLIAATPDLCYVQFGINDNIAATASATTIANLKLALDKIMGAGIPVVFESINPAAVGPASYINGYASTGGYSATSNQGEADTRLAITQAVNSAMQSWLATFPSNIALYVDTSSVSALVTGFANSASYADGTHMSRIGCRASAALIDNAIATYFPRKYGQALDLIYPNGINRSFLSPSSGRASNFSAIQAEAGTMTSTYEIGVDEYGDAVQQYNVTVTALASSRFIARFPMVPDWMGGSPFFTLAAADVMQAAFDYSIDNGSGAAPNAFQVYGRQRIYYDDASNNYADHGPNAAPNSTDHPAMGVERGRIITPRLAIKAAMASANIITNTELQCYVHGNSTGSFRLRIKNPQWAKVA